MFRNLRGHTIHERSLKSPDLLTRSLKCLCHDNEDDVELSFVSAHDVFLAIALKIISIVGLFSEATVGFHFRHKSAKTFCDGSINYCSSNLHVSCSHI